MITTLQLVTQNTTVSNRQRLTLLNSLPSAGHVIATATAQATIATTKAGEAAASLAALTTNGLLDWAYTQSFRLVSATRDSNGAITTASIVWPDGATGTFTTDTASTAFPGAIDAWHATHVVGAVTKTITQTAVTRDADGAVTAQPAITIV